MNSVFKTLLRFSDYFEVHLAPTARETVESSGEDPVGTNLCINSFLATLLLEKKAVSKIQNQGRRNE